MQKIILFALLLVGYTYGLWAQAPDLLKMDIVERSVPDGPVAIVDGAAIEGKEFLRNYRRHITNVSQMVGDPNLNDEFRVHAGLTTLGEMIREEILYKEALARKITVSDSEVQQAYEKKLAAFLKMLEQEGGQKPTEEDVLKKAGQTRSEALASLRKQLLADKASAMIAKEKGVTVTDKEVREYYDKNPNLFQIPGRLHLNQILIVPKPNPAKADEKSWKKAEESTERARARILAGEQFAAVARDVSEAPDAAKGGDMGMLPVVQLPPFFTERAAKMKPGEISGVFRSEYGVHLIKLVDSEAAEEVPFNEAAEKIRQVLLQMKTEDAVLQFCEPIVNDSNRTKIFLQLERTLAALGKGEEKSPEPK